FVLADEQTLSSALDARSPGQGRADELWFPAAHAADLRAALQRDPLTQLSPTFRSDVEQQLRAAPIARGLLGTLVAAAILSGALAVVGLLVSLLGAARDERVESDLVTQGLGPRGLRGELQLRMLLAALLGVLTGLGVAALLTRLAVATVRAAGTVATPRPPLVTVVPWAELALWVAAALGALVIASGIAVRSAVGRQAST